MSAGASAGQGPDLGKLTPAGARASVKAKRPLWKNADRKLSKWASAYRRGHRRHFEQVADLARVANSKSPVRDVLDVGAVPGYVSVILAEAGFNVEAVDLDPSRFQDVFDGAGVATHQADIEHDSLPLADDSFDLAILCQTLEHLRTDPLQPLREIHRVLRPGGRLIASVPQITPYMKWRFFRGDEMWTDPVEQEKKLTQIGHVGDVRLYSERQAELMLRHTGFEVELAIPGGGPAVKQARNSNLARILFRLSPKRMQRGIYFIGVKKADPQPQ